MLVEPDTCTVFDFEVEAFHKFEVLVDVGGISCSAADNLMFLEKAVAAGDCVLAEDDHGCDGSRFDYPAQSLCDYWNTARHRPFQGSSNPTLMSAATGQTCTEKKVYFLGMRSDCDNTENLGFKVVSTPLTKKERRQCTAGNRSFLITAGCVLLAVTALLTVCLVYMFRACCPCCASYSQEKSMSYEEALLQQPPADMDASAGSQKEGIEV